ncbi:MAG: hypothetical protein UU23_C0004G0024 [Candidatus Curtissbacteria bacterium GW2011_GWA1_40_9]|uniref:50S ribosomal protein L29 n=1 Tax=Candidatus Curtissbacteria bacterium GW2011_GWA1_40_9 TaxID=1618408 RepID=A0A0G0WRP8_9BACT|nr:MAG: hypothetical protein UU23_C0004G0024 [Candidatus Curtissbacteria bacterium GW2011_GWA1_40_9]
MKKRELINLKNKSLKDLISLVGDMKKTITESKLELKLSRVKNVHETNRKQKELAQILTFIRIKQLEDENEKTSHQIEKDVKISKDARKGVKNGTN